MAHQRLHNSRQHRAGRVIGRVGPGLVAYLLSAAVAAAADTTPPTKPVVTDDGTYTADATTLHATWTSSDLESGIMDYQYLIRQDSTSGAIIINWTSTGTTASVTRTALSLLQGKKYYIGVKAKNGAGLWSTIGYSNGIKVDTIAPSAPGLPTEGSTTDLDYNGTGFYTVYWPAASDLESSISAYEVQERVGFSGSWTSLTTTRTSANFAVTGRLDKTRYGYQIRAKNGAGIWGAFSPVSDGVLIDKTAPTSVTIADDGATTTSATTLHATWTASTDAESGLAQYEYLIRQDSTAGPIIVNWTSTGLATEVTKTALSLIQGKTYFLGVRAKNHAALYSSITYSNGITMMDISPPTVTITAPVDGAVLGMP